MRRVRILYGEMGSGKTYLGRQEAEALGCTFLEGDDCIPPAMRELVRGFKPLPKSMIDDYVKNHLFPAIVNAARDDDVVVAQALYRREHRDYITSRLASEGIYVRCVRPQTPFWQNLRQLWSRPRGFRWVVYWLMSKPFFQA
jgi:gluconate kinase